MSSGAEAAGADAKAHIEANKALARRFMDEVLNKGNLAVADELLAPDLTFYSPGDTPDNPQPLRGAEGFKDFVVALRTGFPDLHITIDDMIAEEDRLALRCMIRGTQLGPYRGIPPTGRRVLVSETLIFHFVDGIPTECWQDINALGMLMQLGVVPPAGGGPVGLLRWTLGTIVRFARLEMRDARRRRAMRQVAG